MRRPNITVKGSSIYDFKSFERRIGLAILWPLYNMKVRDREQKYQNTCDDTVRRCHKWQNSLCFSASFKKMREKPTTTATTTTTTTATTTTLPWQHDPKCQKVKIEWDGKDCETFKTKTEKALLLRSHILVQVEHCKVLFKRANFLAFNIRHLKRSGSI